MSNSVWNDIWTLGEELVECPEQCEGITNAPSRFIPPRCLYLEPRNAETIDCVVIGMNPGKINENNIESKFYMEHGLTYSVLYDFWYDYRSARPDAEYKGHKYNREIRKFLEDIELIPNESILWTELCKCQSTKREPPLQTYRTCMSRYLNRELELVEKDTPLICVGNTVYRAMAFRYTENVVIGVPHPTGSYGHWDQLTCNEEMMKKAVNLISEAKDLNLSVKIFPKNLQKTE